MLTFLIVVIIYLLMSLLTFMAYAIDKWKAEADDWRIPEKTLHILELLGGWPGGLVAQRRLRHKNHKFSYQMVFRAIIGTHLFLIMLWLIIIF